MTALNAFRLAPLALGLGLALSQAAIAAEPSLQVKSGTPVVSAGDTAPAYTVKVAYPDGRVFSSEILAGESIAIDPRSPGAGYAEGFYRVELSPILGLAQRTGESNDQLAKQDRASVATVTQGFRIIKGQVFVSNGPEPSTQTNNDSDLRSQQKDQVFLDDLIVDGSACVGQDCANGENFGFDTVRLKENNLRLHFDDTSSTGSFPSNDWRIVANDSSNGGDSYLAIEDSTAGRIPFRITAGAPANSLFVSSAGRIGFGTATPSVQMHQKNGNTPTLRLEQDGSNGFASQTWDVAGNEAGFFVRDASNGSTLPFRIKPGSPGSSVHIFPTGVSINKSSDAQAPLDVNGDSLVRGFLRINRSSQSAVVFEENAIVHFAWFLDSGLDQMSLGRYDASGNFVERAVEVSKAVGGPTLFTGSVDIKSDTLRLRNSKTPASSSSACSAGEMAWDASFIYVCVSTNSWKRSALSTW